MRNIRKSKYKIFPSDYSESRDFYSLTSLKKEEVRNRLVQEQGYLCCYYMMRIHGMQEDTNIEHNKPRSKYPELIFDYSNLLAACTRTKGEKKRTDSQTCDIAKGESEISKNPALNNVEVLIQYDINGNISSKDPTFHNDLVKTLNLNHKTLVESRKALLKPSARGSKRNTPADR